MPNSTRTLPAVIGPTENALRAVLLAVLSGTRIDGYDEWAAINVVNRHGPENGAQETIRAVAEPLGIAHPAARVVLDSLVTKGFLDSEGASWTVSGDGSAVLQQARARVATVTERLVEGLSPAEIEVAVRVLISSLGGRTSPVARPPPVRTSAKNLDGGAPAVPWSATPVGSAPGPAATGRRPVHGARRPVGNATAAIDCRCSAARTCWTWVNATGTNHPA